MWPKSRRKLAASAQSLLAKTQARGWKSEAERDALLEDIAALKGLEPPDFAWLAVDSDSVLRRSRNALLAPLPYEEVEASLLPYLVSRTEAMRRLAIEALATHAGPLFPDKLPGLLNQRDPAIVSTALDWLRRNPSDRNLSLAAVALNSVSPGFAGRRSRSSKRRPRFVSSRSL